LYTKLSDKMSQAHVQTTLYSLDRTQSLTAPPSENDGNTSKGEKASDDIENNLQPPAAPEFEQDDGVTRIEALCEFEALFCRLQLIGQILFSAKVSACTHYGLQLV
jgi:hypothetical protein